MGIMTGGVVICQTAAKKCEVKLERLSTASTAASSSTSSANKNTSNKFKRPRPSVTAEIIKKEDFDEDDDLRPPVKLKVKIGNGTNPCQVQLVNSSQQNQQLLPEREAKKVLKSTAQVQQQQPGSNQTTASQVDPQARKYEPSLPKAEAPKPIDISLDSLSLKKLITEDLGFEKDGRVSTSLLVGDHCKPITPNPGPICLPPSRPTVSLGNDELLPPTPCIYVNSADEAFSPQLLDQCLKRPIVLIRNLANACDMDLGLYTTKTLVETHPHHPVEIRSQLEQTSDENWAPNMEKPVWYCTSSRSHTTIAKYAEYQSETIKEYFDQNSNEEKTANPKFDFSGQSTRRTIKFGTNCDLSDEKKWGPQLRELNKLPAWSRVVSAGNMLSHIGNQILGMNTVQLYMKVPCARTPGHQENNNFCAVNINIGPGDSEWFGVPNDYWGALQNLCDANKVDYLHGSWWPSMEELRAAGIPCYRFMQRPGDLVWVNVGCVHWVQAAGWCNNIAWNVGPLTERQYILAMERYEWNKSQRYQSIVAMNLLSWNLARNLKATDVGLYQAIRSALQQSLRNSIQTQSFVRSKNVPVKFHGRRKNEPAHYCGLCDEEVFNNLLVKEHEKRHVVHCLRCSVSADPELKGMICLEEYTLDELCLVYEDFKLVSTCTASMPTSGLGYCEKSTVIPTIKTTTSLKAVGVEEL